MIVTIEFTRSREEDEPYVQILNEKNCVDQHLAELDHLEGTLTTTNFHLSPLEYAYTITMEWNVELAHLVEAYLQKVYDVDGVEGQFSIKSIVT